MVGDEQVSIVIATYRQGEMLRGCLESVAASLGPIGDGYEVVCVVNGAQFQWANSLVGPLAGVKLVDSPVNLGFSGGYNLAISESRGRYVALLNDDTIVQPNWLPPLVRAMETIPRVGAVGSLNVTTEGIIEEAGSVVFSGAETYGAGRGLPADSLEWDFVRDVDYCSASSLLVRRDVWDEVGGLDESFHPAYHEDVDLCLRMKEAGYRIIFEPRSKVVHHVSQSTDPRFRRLLMERNKDIPLHRHINKLRETMPWRFQNIECRTERAAQRARATRRHVLAIDDLLPSSGIGSGFSRPLQLLKDLQNDRQAVSMYTSVGEAYTSDAMRDLGVRVIEGELEDYLRRPDIVIDAAIISRPTNTKFLHLIRETQPHAAVIMDHEALYHRRLFRQAELARTPEDAERFRREGNEMREREAAAIRAVDLNVCISEEEAQFARTVEGAAETVVLEPRAPETVPTEASLDGRRDMLFVAGWMAGPGSPNVDALEWFAEHVLPRVRAAVPWARVRVTGASPPAAVRALAGDAVRICGFVDDLPAAYRAARVVIAPIRFGAGVKIKTVEALEFGVPTVATVVGAEGIELGAHTDSLSVSDDPAAQADRLIALLTDADEWRRARAAVDRLLTSWSARGSMPWGEIVDAAVAAKRRRCDRPISFADSQLLRLT